MLDADLSAEALVQRRIAELDNWLSAQGVDVRDGQAHPGSRDRVYWHYGYFIGLQEALKLLTTQGATLH